MSKMKKYKYEKYEYPSEWKIKTFEDYIKEWENEKIKQIMERVNKQIFNDNLLGLQDMTFTDNMNYAFNRAVPAYVTTIPAEYVTESTAFHTK